MASRQRLAVLMSTGALIAGCNSILGIEDLNSGPRSGGSGGTSGGVSGGGNNAQSGSGAALGGSSSGKGGAGATAGSGATATSGSAGTSTTNGGSTGTGGSGPAITGGGGVVSTGGTTSSGGDAGAGGDAGGLDGGGAGGDSGGTGGTGTGGTGTGGTGTGGTSTGGTSTGGTFNGTVRGKIVNLWGYPQNGVTVKASGVTASATTAVDGSFTLSGVTAPYDLSFVVVATNNASVPLATHAWLFKGLRRSDPTLRVYRGGPENDAYFTLTQTGAVTDSTLKFGCSVAFTYGRASRGMTSGGITASVPLSGADGGQGIAHALSFFLGADGMPNRYSSHGSHALTLDKDDEATQAIDMTPTTAIREGTLSGTVVSTGTGDRLNFAWLQFTDNSLIKLGEHEPTTANFSYTVPELAGASVTVAANQGDRNQGPYALVHKNGLGIGSTATLTLPTPATVSTPLPGATINSSTVFQWTGGAPVSLLKVQSAYRWIYIVTSEHNTTIPSSLFQTLGIVSGNALEFRVEGHGSVASVDAATGTQGFLDEFSHQDISPDSATPGDGSFSFSKLASGTFTP